MHTYLCLYTFIRVYITYSTHIRYTSQLTIVGQQLHLSRCSQALMRKQTSSCGGYEFKD